MATSTDVAVAQNGGQGNIKLHPYLISLLRWCVSYVWGTASVLLHRLMTTPLQPITGFKPSGRRAPGNEHLHPEPRVECQLLHHPAIHTMDVIFVHGLYGSLGNTWRQGDWRQKYVADPKIVTLRDHSKQNRCKCFENSYKNHIHNENKCDVNENNEYKNHMHYEDITDLNDPETSYRELNEKLAKKVFPEENDLITEQFYNNTLVDQDEIIDNYETQAKFVHDMFKKETNCDRICEDNLNHDKEYNRFKCDLNNDNKFKCTFNDKYNNDDNYGNGFKWDVNNLKSENNSDYNSKYENNECKEYNRFKCDSNIDNELKCIYKDRHNNDSSFKCEQDDFKSYYDFKCLNKETEDKKECQCTKDKNCDKVYIDQNDFITENDFKCKHIEHNEYKGTTNKNYDNGLIDRNEFKADNDFKYKANENNQFKCTKDKNYDNGLIDQSEFKADNDFKCKHSENNVCKCIKDKNCEAGCGCTCNDCYSMCWPKDWIKADFPGARVISINYTSDPYLWRPLWIKENKRLNLYQRAEQMIEQLLEMGVGEKPIVWVGHSKGGLFIKQIYCEAHEAYMKINKKFRKNDKNKEDIFDKMENSSAELNNGITADNIDTIIGHFSHEETIDDQVTNDEIRENDFKKANDNLKITNNNHIINDNYIRKYDNCKRENYNTTEKDNYTREDVKYTNENENCIGKTDNYTRENVNYKIENDNYYYTREKDNYTRVNDKHTKENDNGSREKDNYTRVNDKHTKENDNGSRKKDNYTSENFNYNKENDSYIRENDNYTRVNDKHTKENDNGSREKDNYTSENCNYNEENDSYIKENYNYYYTRQKDNYRRVNDNHTKENDNGSREKDKYTSENCNYNKEKDNYTRVNDNHTKENDNGSRENDNYTKDNDNYIRNDNITNNACVINEMINDNSNIFEQINTNDNINEINDNIRNLRIENGDGDSGEILKDGTWEIEELSSSIEARLSSRASLWSRSRGFMFYSVPHRGSPLADIKTPVTARSVDLLEIAKDCPLVLELQSRWQRAVGPMNEAGGACPAVRSVVETGRTLMSVLWLRIVSTESADAGFGTLSGISVDHREICKPTSRACPLYTMLKDLIHEATTCTCQSFC